MGESAPAYAGGLRCHGGLPGGRTVRVRSQIRRSCSSVPANIAEGCGRDTDADFARFLQNSAGSAIELEYQLLLAEISACSKALNTQLSTPR